MPNSHGTLVVGDWVSYLAPGSVRWRAVKVVSLASQTSVSLAYVRSDGGARIPINGAAFVAKRTGPTQTDVWRRF
jgi:hypothetical protein